VLEVTNMVVLIILIHVAMDVGSGGMDRGFVRKELAFI
jgi:hypothetical protein